MSVDHKYCVVRDLVVGLGNCFIFYCLWRICIMIDWLIFIVLGALILASIIDLKYKAVPSVALTGILFLVAVMRVEYLHFGILAGLFAWIIKDLIADFNGLDFGMADIKIMILIGFMIPTMNFFLIFVGIFALFQLVYTLAWIKFVGGDTERPFIPCLLFVYIAMVLIGGVV